MDLISKANMIAGRIICQNIRTNKIKMWITCIFCVGALLSGSSASAYKKISTSQFYEMVAAAITTRKFSDKKHSNTPSIKEMHLNSQFLGYVAAKLEDLQYYMTGNAEAISILESCAQNVSIQDIAYTAAQLANTDFVSDEMLNKFNGDFGLAITFSSCGFYTDEM